MKRSLVIMIGLLSAFQAHAGRYTCKTSTLKGLYVYHSTGVMDGNAFAESGNEVFDGKGNVTGSSVDSADSHGQLVGTYVINPDCTGTISYTLPVPLEEDIHLGPKGDTFTYIDHHPNSGQVVSGVETRQSK